MKNVKLPSANTVLIYCAAVANISLWIAAGIASEGLTPLSVVSSAALGIAMSLGLVQIAQRMTALSPTNERTRKDGTRRIMPNGKYWLALGSFVVILAFEPVLLAPVIVANSRGVSLAALTGEWLWGWSGGRVMAAALVLAGLAAVGGAHKAQPTAETTQPTQTQSTATAKPKQNAPLYTCSVCGWDTAAAEKAGKNTTKAIAGHAGKHRVKP